MKGSPKRTLILFDDDVPLMKAFTGFLRPAGYDVVVAADEGALHRAMETAVRPAILFVDYSLLAEAGAAFIASFRDIFAPALAGCRIVGWSSLDAKSAKSLDPELYAAVDAFCEKPFDEDELLAIVDKFLPRT